MLYTKYESSGPCSFGQEDFWKLHFENLFLTLWPTYATNWNGLNNFDRGPPRDLSCEVWSKSNKWFQRRCCLKKLLRLKSLRTTHDGRRTKTELSTLCSGELKNKSQNKKLFIIVCEIWSLHMNTYEKSHPFSKTMMWQLNLNCPTVTLWYFPLDKPGKKPSIIMDHNYYLQKTWHCQWMARKLVCLILYKLFIYTWHTSLAALKTSMWHN